MSNERWNDDVAYAFSIHRLCLKIYGVWPLEAQTVFTRALWISWAVGLPFIVTAFTSSNEKAISNIEPILQGTSAIIALIKLLSFAGCQKQLDTNINAATDDWLSADDETTRTIMKKYARRSRTLTLLLLYSAVGCFSIYVSTILLLNVKQLFFTDPNSVDANATTWVFLIPSGNLGDSVSGEQYAVLLTIQIVQTFSICSLQAIGDSFFFNVTMHLTGQLEVLKNKFRTFADEPEANCRQKFVDLVNRHGELMGYYQNLEDTFHFVLLVELVIITVLLALIGLRIDLLLSKGNHSNAELIQNFLVMNYFLLQSAVITYAGDLLQGESEDIFVSLYATSWFKLPVTLMKDLNFAIMRSSVPFRLSGGKFIYVNRETMMNMLKTAASYVSVLRIALQE